MSSTNQTTNPDRPYSGVEILEEAMSATLARNWWAVALRGLCAVLFGLIALIAPGAAMLSLVVAFALYMLIDAGFAIVSAVRAARQGERWMLLVLQAIANIAVAAVSLFWPGLTVVAFVLMIGAWAVVSGAFSTVAAFRLKKDHGRWWMALGGIASIIFGALVLIAPLIGAVVLTWWLAAYALVYGVILLVLAFRLRPHRGEQPPHATLAPA